MNNNAGTTKRTELISAILNSDVERMKLLSQLGKRVIVLDTFLDGLKCSSSGAFEDDSIAFIRTDNYNKMCEQIEAI